MSFSDRSCTFCQFRSSVCLKSHLGSSVILIYLRPEPFIAVTKCHSSVSEGKKSVTMKQNESHQRSILTRRRNDRDYITSLIMSVFEISSRSDKLGSSLKQFWRFYLDKSATFVFYKYNAFALKQGGTVHYLEGLLSTSYLVSWSQLQRKKGQ